MNLLVEILKKNKWICDKDPHCKDKRAMAHTYLEIYEKLFNIFQNEPINFLEIGVLKGASLRLWHSYFVNANIYGVDLFTRGWKGTSFDEVEKYLSDCERIQLLRLDSCSNNLDLKKERESILSDFNKFNIIVDDGSHEMDDQIQTFYNFKPFLHEDGLYIIEDIGWTNNQEFEPSDILNHLPSEFQIIDMRFPEKVDNALVIFYNKNSKYADYFDSIMKSKFWETQYEFSYEYVYKKWKNII